MRIRRARLVRKQHSAAGSRSALCSESCAKRQPANAHASPCTMPMRAPPTSATRCIGSAASRARAPGFSVSTRRAAARNLSSIALERSTSSSGTDSGYAQPHPLASSSSASSVSTLPRNAACRATLLVDVCKGIDVGVEPVVVAVKNDLRVDGFARGHVFDLGEREAIAVQPADDVQHFGLQLRRTRKG